MFTGNFFLSYPASICFSQSYAIPSKMAPQRFLLTVFGLLAGVNARLYPASKTVRINADRGVVYAPPLPTSTLVTDFQKDGVNSSWAEGHPKAWSAAAVSFKGPSVADVSSDQKLLVLASNGGELTIRSLETLELITSLSVGQKGSADSVSVIQGSDSGYDVFVESDNYPQPGTITHVRLSSSGTAIGSITDYLGGFTRRIDGRRGPFSPDGRRFITVGSRPLDREVVIYDLDRNNSNVTLTGHLDTIISAVFSPDGSLVSSTGWDGYGRIWNASTGELLHNLGPSNSQNWLTNFSPDGKYVAVTNAGKESSVKIWPISNLSAEPIAIRNFKSWIRSAAWSSDSKFLAAGTYGLVQVFSMDEQKVVQRWECEDPNYEAGSISWIENEGSGLKLKYRWGPEGHAQYNGAGSGDTTFVLKSKDWIGGGDADASTRFYEIPL
jgi:WD40 repeat protein